MIKYSFIMESQNINSSKIKHICEKSMHKALECNTIIEAKNVLSAGYQQCMAALSQTEPSKFDVHCINVLEKSYLEMNKHGTEWKPVLHKFLNYL